MTLVLFVRTLAFLASMPILQRMMAGFAGFRLQFDDGSAKCHIPYVIPEGVISSQLRRVEHEKPASSAASVGFRACGAFSTCAKPRASRIPLFSRSCLGSRPSNRAAASRTVI
jgi:hypothetical protein